jgi:hypothetical protein
MRHVDDAHDTKGDGEAQGRDQQHRAEAGAVKNALADTPQTQLEIDGGDGGFGGVAHCRRRVGDHQQDSAGLLGAFGAQHGHRIELGLFALAGGAGGEQGGGAGQGDGRVRRGVGFVRQCGVE